MPAMENPWPIVGALLLGLIGGAALAAFYYRMRIVAAVTEARAPLEAEKAALLEQARRVPILEDEAAKAATLRVRVAELETEQKAAEENRVRIITEFKALSAQALESNNESFLRLAGARFEAAQQNARGELEKKEQAFAAIVKPVSESLAKVDTKIQELEQKREGAYQKMIGQVEMLLQTQTELRSETGNLVKALRSPVARGQWGELQLKRVVELAGMLEHCDFEQQIVTRSQEGLLRPDLLVRLPSDRRIVVDAKTPLRAYLDAAQSEDDAVRRDKLNEHAAAVRDHISALGRKAYWEQFTPAPEFVVLFLPGESFFSAALQHDPELIETAWKHRVLIATPTTLIALLRAIAHGWREERLAENAQAISELGRELYKRLSDMSEHWTRLGRGLSGAVESYNKAVGSLETRVLSTARKFKDLQAAPEKLELPELDPIDSQPRLLRAPEMTGEPFDK